MKNQKAMFEKLIHHLGVHACQHPKETLATVMTIGKAVAPIAPYIAGAAAALALIVYLWSED